MRGPLALRGAGPRGHHRSHHGSREQIWGHPQAAQGAHGKQGGRGCSEGSRFWRCSRNSPKIEHFRSSWAQWREERLGAPAGCIRIKHNSTKAPQNIPSGTRMFHSYIPKGFSPFSWYGRRSRMLLLSSCKPQLLFPSPFPSTSHPKELEV